MNATPARERTLCLCGDCAGSGEGMYPGSTCHVCRGKGEVALQGPSDRDDDEEDEP